MTEHTKARREKQIKIDDNGNNDNGDSNNDGDNGYNENHNRKMLTATMIRIITK